MWSSWKKFELRSWGTICRRNFWTSNRWRKRSICRKS
jgi:hypothetical protein